MMPHRVTVLMHPVGMSRGTRPTRRGEVTVAVVHMPRPVMVAVVVAMRRGRTRAAHRGSHRQIEIHASLCPSATQGKHNQAEYKKGGKEILFHSTYMVKGG